MSSSKTHTIQLAGAIFDFDGTLFESMHVWYGVLKTYLKQRDITPKDDIDEVSRTLSFSEMIALFKKDYFLEDSLEKIATDLRAIITEAYRHEVMPKPGALELLESMHKAGIKMAVASASPLLELELAIDRLGIRKYFEAIISVEEIGRGKTYSDVYDVALMHLGTRKLDTWVFEDAYHAALTAKHSGYKVLSVKDWSSANQEPELRDLCDVYVESLEELEVEYATLPQKMSPYKYLKSVLTIAGSDSSGGAGVQADLKTFLAHGVYGQSVINSITSQNTTGVQEVFDIPAQTVASQIDSVFSDIVPDAVKIGMLSSPEIIKTVADKLKEYKPKHVVLDPVMVAQSGGSLMHTEALDNLKNLLLPLASVITPNLYEASVLSDTSIKTKEDMLAAAHKLSDLTGATIVLKGGHLQGDALDLVLIDGKEVWLEAKRIDNENTHGTGCTLSSAIACNLARGEETLNAIKGAKNYVNGAIASQMNIGRGSGPLDHIYQHH